MNQIRERCHLIYRNAKKSLAVFVSEKSEFTYHRCRYRDTEQHRHLRNIKQRQSYAESHLWETKEEIGWDCWYLQWSIALASKGIGSESLSAFFGFASRRANRVFCQCLERTGSTAQQQIIAYGQAQAEASHGEQPIGIWVGGDETFYGHSRGHGISQWIYLQWSRMWEPHLPNMVGAGEWVV